MTEPRKMTDEELIAAIDADLSSARTFCEGKVADERALAYRYYHGMPLGNEVKGRSQVISQVVMEVVDSLMPDLMKVFCSGESAVQFVARNAEDVELAEQATEVCNYIFFSQNNGFLLLYEAIKDALLQKTGAFKYGWKDESKVQGEAYSGLTEAQLMLVAGDPEVEIVAATPYPDPNPQPGPDGQPIQSQLYDVQLKRSVKSGHVCIATVPPDELRVTDRANTVITQDLSFIAHVTPMTRSALVEMGYPLDVVMELPTGDDSVGMSPEAAARQERTEGQYAGVNDDADPMQQEVVYVEAYKLIDYDGDGISERRKVCKVGSTLLHQELADRVPLSTLTPKIMPHEFIGVSLADDTMDLQLLKSTLWRQMLDNLYLTNNPRQIVLEGQARLEDLMTPQPGGVIRAKVPGAVTPLEVPFVAGASFQMVEFLEQEIEGRTPVSRYYQGLSPDAINKTATGVSVLTSRSQARVELIARTFAETGIKDLFRGILWLLGKYQQKELIIRLNNKYVPIDPRAWTTEYDMSVNVGLGTGNKQEQMQFLQLIAQAQAQAVQAGGMGTLVLPKNIYNTQAKIANLAGFKDPGVFWNDPGDEFKPPPPQKPELVQAEEVKGQIALQKMDKVDATEIAKAKISADKDLRVARQENALEGARIGMDAQQQTHDQKMDNVKVILEALSKLSDAMNAPKVITRDRTGRATGVRRAA